MPKIKHKSAIPYGGSFAINAPEKGLVGSGSSFGILLNKVKEWRTANGWPVGLGLEEEVTMEVCRLYPAECDETSELVPQRDGITAADVVTGTRMVLAHWWNNRKLVSQEEANRRGSICRNCANNIHVPTPCGGLCGDLKSVVESFVGTESRATPNDGALKNCAICACWLSTAVWVPNEISTVGLSDVQKAQFQTAKEQFGCWKAG